MSQANPRRRRHIFFATSHATGRDSLAATTVPRVRDGVKLPGRPVGSHIFSYVLHSAAGRRNLLRSAIIPWPMASQPASLCCNGCPLRRVASVPAGVSRGARMHAGRAHTAGPAPVRTRLAAVFLASFSLLTIDV